jgi:hypothetical protein
MSKIKNDIKPGDDISEEPRAIDPAEVIGRMGLLLEKLENSERERAARNARWNEIIAAGKELVQKSDEVVENARIERVTSPRLQRDMPAPKVLRIQPKPGLT